MKDEFELIDNKNFAGIKEMGRKRLIRLTYSEERLFDQIQGHVQKNAPEGVSLSENAILRILMEFYIEQKM